MQVKVNVMKAVSIPDLFDPRKRTDLKKGVYDIDDALFDHWYMKALLQEKIIIPVKGRVREMKAEEKEFQRIEIKSPEIPPSMQETKIDLGVEVDITEIKKIDNEVQKISVVKKRRKAKA
jgi:hypothetical protein